MNHRSSLLPTLSLAGLGALGLVLAIGSPAANASASSNAPARMYEVTITNLTRNQIFSPPLIAIHDSSVAMFEPGMAASPELAALAEDGDSAALSTLMMADPGVLDVQSAAAGVPPGGSVSFTVPVDYQHAYLSGAGMLVTTNDAFVGLDALTMDASLDRMVFYVPAYDAGSEFNSEDCAFIPGPPCGNGGVHDPTPAEGYIYISNGISGIGSLAPEDYDWHNPVAMVTVVRL